MTGRGCKLNLQGSESCYREFVGITTISDKSINVLLWSRTDFEFKDHAYATFLLKLTID